MKHRRFWSAFFLAATLLTAAIIFWFSSKSGIDSSAMSDPIALYGAKILKPDFEQLPEAARQTLLEQVSLLVRKCAHFLEFALLGFNMTAWLRLRRRDPSRLAFPLDAWGLSTLYACTDEVHQMFVSERSPALLDVCVDSAGSLTGALLATLGLALLRRCLRRA